MQTAKVKENHLPALQNQLLPGHSVLCQFPSETFKQYILIDISNTLTYSNHIVYSILLVLEN